MASFNKCIFAGHLTRDPQVRALPSQVSACEFGIAVNHRYTSGAGEKKEDVLFLDCVAFGKQADALGQYCAKGTPLLVEGRLKLETWDDKQTGQKRSKHKLMVDSFQFLAPRQQDDPPHHNPQPKSGGKFLPNVPDPTHVPW